jgi:hypothetical protein
VLVLLMVQLIVSKVRVDETRVAIRCQEFEMQRRMLMLGVVLVVLAK